MKDKSQQCQAMVGKRHAPNGPRRCKHNTARGVYCWQHLKEKDQLRITKVPDAKLGLITTEKRDKSDKIASFRDGTAQYAQPNIRPNAKKYKSILKATKDINKNTEITVPVASRAIKIISPPIPIKKKMRLIKPNHGPDPPELIFKPWPEDKIKPVRKKSSKPRMQRSRDEKYEILLLKKLVGLQKLFNDKKLADILKTPILNRVINVPKRESNKPTFQYGNILNELLTKERKRWIDHVNKSPNIKIKMTRDKADDIIKKLIKPKK